jgi:G3E family GTPase
VCCCEIRGDLIDAVLRVLDGNADVQHVVLEASGVADPGGIFATFADPVLSERIRVEGIVCVLDAEQVFAYPEYPALLDLKLRQVGFADMLIINKVDLAGPEQLRDVHTWLDAHFSRLRIVETSHCQVALPLILGVGASHSVSPLPTHELEPAHEDENTRAFSSWSYETADPLSLTALGVELRRLPGTVFRIKGIVFAADQPENRHVLQVVGRRVTITPGEPWDEESPSTRIVAIGPCGELNPETLETAVEASRASVPLS